MVVPRSAAAPVLLLALRSQRAAPRRGLLGRNSLPSRRTPRESVESALQGVRRRAARRGAQSARPGVPRERARVVSLELRRCDSHRRAKACVGATVSRERTNPLPGFAIEPLRAGPKKLFSVDVEDWFHSNFRSAPRLDDAALERRVGAGIAELLDLLSLAQSRATFFVLGAVAEENPSIVKRIADAGHEIASHSLSHVLLYEQRDRKSTRLN